MTPLEIAAKARWEARNAGFGEYWEELTKREQREEYDDMRAGLLALAEVELPEDVMKSGRDALLHEREWRISEAVQAREAFRAMLRSIAGGTNV